MLFIVPNLDPPEQTNAEQASGNSSEEKSGGTQPPIVNVELDLDDAPFLDEEAPEQAPEPQEEMSAVQPKQEVEKPSLKSRLLQNKKRLILAGIAFLVLIVAAIAVNMFLFSEPVEESVEESVPQVQEAELEPERIVVPSQPGEQGPVPAKYLIEFKPFWVPMKGPEGEIIFFVYEFSVPTDDPQLQMEVQSKIITLRDAVYHYLSHKPLDFLADKNGAKVLQEDIISVLNENLTAGKVSQIYVKDYHTVGS